MTLFLLLPSVSLFTGAFPDPSGGFTLPNIARLFEPSILAAYRISVEVSAASAILGAVFGFLLAQAVDPRRPAARAAAHLMTFSGVASNFAGVPLAFAFLATLGRLGIVTVVLGFLGIDIYGLGFNLLSFWGLTLTYLYFQIPLMALIVTPALDGLRREWREAAETLGASPLRYWRDIALPILWPSLLGCTLLLFANAFGAIATAYALTGSSLNIVTILLYAQIRGDVLHDPNLGYALAFGMVVITGVCNLAYIRLSASREPAGRAMRRDPHPAVARGRRSAGSISSSRCSALSSSPCACAAASTASTPTAWCLPIRASRPASPIPPRSRSPPSCSASCSWFRPPTPCGCACRACAASSSCSRCMPLVVPAIVLVFGYIRASTAVPRSCRSPTTALGADLLLVCGYVALALPYMYRAVDTGLAAIDVHTLTEAAESLGAGSLTILVQVILPNLRAALAGGAFLTFAIVIGEFTIASLLDRPTFGPYMQLLGANRAYEPAALAVLAFLLTWGSMVAHERRRAPPSRRGNSAMPFLELSHVHKSFASHAAVEDFSLAVEQGEFVSFLGPSGCGKTTSLRMVAGFEMPTSGAIHIGGQDVTYVPTAKRRIGMVFQAYALFPNMTVARNIAFGLRVAGMPSPTSTAASTRCSTSCALRRSPAAIPRSSPAASSSASRSPARWRRAAPPAAGRTALRTRCADPRRMRAEIRALQRTLGITTIFVTHDQEEALSLSDRIVVMSAGRIEQVGTPIEIYNTPRTRFVAGFVGTTNVLNARVLDSAAGDIEIDGQPIRTTRPLNGAASLAVALRPEALRLGDALPCHLTGTAEEVAFLGSIVRVKVRLGAQALVIDQFNARDVPPPASNAPVILSFAPQDLNFLD